MVRVARMRHDICSSRLVRASQDKPASPPSSTSPLVRFPYGHVVSEAQLAARLRERRYALWIGCPRCNVIAVAVAIIEPQ
jgi:hypothetical protein